MKNILLFVAILLLVVGCKKDSQQIDDSSALKNEVNDFLKVYNDKKLD